MSINAERTEEVGFVTASGRTFHSFFLPGGNIHADMKEPSEVSNSKQKDIRRISLQRFTAYNRGYTFRIANTYKKGDTTGVQHDDHEMGQLAGHKNPGPDHAGEDVEHRRQDRVRHLSP